MLVATHDRYSAAQAYNTKYDYQITVQHGAWTNETNANRIGDNTYAEDTWDTSADTDGDILDVFSGDGSEPGLAIPSDATIDGITVRIERKASDTPVFRDKVIRLFKGGTLVGDNKATATAYPLTDTTVTYGSASDLWGTTWTPAEVNAADFGLRFQAESTSSSGDQIIYIDRLIICVDYTLASPGHVTAFDSSVYEPQLWTYDAGLTPTSSSWRFGRPQIDADGNIYAPYAGVISATPTTEGYLVKLDRDGNELWTYSAGASSQIGITLLGGGCCAILDNGNIIFSHPATTTGDYFLTILDPDGAVVLQIVRPGGSPVTTSCTQATPALDVDSSGNIYLMPYDIGAANTQRLWKFDSSGTYVSQNLPGTAVQTLHVARGPGKLYLGGATSTGTLATVPIFAKVDISAMTTDWQVFCAEIESTVATANCDCRGICLDSTETMFIGVYSNLSAGGVVLTRWADIDSTETVLVKNREDPTGVGSGNGQYGAINPISDTQFVARLSGTIGIGQLLLVNGSTLEIEREWLSLNNAASGATDTINGSFSLRGVSARTA